MAGLIRRFTALGRLGCWEIRNLLWMAIHNIIYIRGLFHESYFSDMSVPALEMKTKMLLPVDAQSRKMIDWMEKGVYDALQKKYLRSLLFCIYEEGHVIEEYAFSFSYSSNCTEEVVMSISRTGSKKGSTTFKSNASQVTPHQMRSSACKMIRRLISLMKTLDPMPEERTILMKLLYYDDITPEDYEPPFLKLCDNNDTIYVWNKNPLKMDLESVYSKHIVLALKVKNVHQPFDDNYVTNRDDGMSVDEKSDYDYFPNIETPKRRSGYLLVTSSKKLEFMLDSGATHHICNDKEIMHNLKDIKEEDQVLVYSCGGVELKAEMMGSVVTKNFKLSQVGFIPKMAFNVVSVGQLASQGLLTTISDGHFSIISVKDARMVGEGFLQKKVEKDTGRKYYEYVFRTMIWDVPGDDKLIDAYHENERDEDVKEWVIDTGCGSHMVPKLTMLSNPRSEKISLQAASETISSSHKGSVKEGKLLLKDVLYCPGVTSKIISGPMLDLSGHRIAFNAERCTIVHKDGLEPKGVGLLERSTRMYLLKADDEENLAEVATKDELLEERKNENNAAEEDAERTDKRVTAEAEGYGLLPDGKDVKTKGATAEYKGKASRRTKRRKLSRSST
ncbi:unnamed protein product [Urochloa decumbens]|uniref:HORMA domain-containing protein n=1 Tax=Urochloa decumbens TaxID=240449 RepID=A0ABC9FDG6_9POAL